MYELAWWRHSKPPPLPFNNLKVKKEMFSMLPISALNSTRPKNRLDKSKNISNYDLLTSTSVLNIESVIRCSELMGIVQSLAHFTICMDNSYHFNQSVILSDYALLSLLVYSLTPLSSPLAFFRLPWQVV